MCGVGSLCGPSLEHWLSMTSLLDVFLFFSYSSSSTPKQYPTNERRRSRYANEDFDVLGTMYKTYRI